MARKRRPTTDSGTVVLHILLLTTFCVLLLTGLRIAYDDPSAPSLAALDGVLPVENLWYRHLFAALVMMATLAGYAVYIVRARLFARVRLDGPRLAGLRRSGNTRLAALHTFAYWGLMISLVAEIVSGVALFAGYGQPHLAIHLWATAFCMVSVAAHVMLQAAMGGVAQVTRIFRPAPLVVAPPPPDLAELLAEQLSRNAEPRIRTTTSVHAHPVATAAAVMFAIGTLAVGAENASRPELRVRLISPAEAPQLDGDLSDPVWAATLPVSVLTTQGGDFGGNGESQVDIRAVHDGEFVYFAFTWADPTRSLKHLPLVKSAEGWHVAQTEHEHAAESLFYEDKFSVLFAPASFPLIGAAIHLTSSSSSTKAASSTGRGLHYTPGFITDVWLWRASHQGQNGHIDNAHFGAPADPTVEQIEGRSRYAGGFALDPGRPAYRANVQGPNPKSSADSVTPSRLPRDLAATTRALGRLSGSALESESEGARWWMTEGESVPYSAAADRAIANGTVIPGIVMQDVPDDRTTVRGAARWAAGRWTLEVARRLYTGSRFDIQMKSGVLMWVAAFDHAETRHSRHLRPFRLEIE